MFFQNFDFNTEWSKASKITDNISQGNFPSSANKKNLVENEITHILVAGKDLEKYFPDKLLLPDR